MQDEIKNGKKLANLKDDLAANIRCLQTSSDNSELVRVMEDALEYITDAQVTLRAIADSIAKVGYDMNKTLVENVENQITALTQEIANSEELQDQVDKLNLQVQALWAGTEPDTWPAGPDFMFWLADRLEYVYGESPNISFVRALRHRAESLKKGIELYLNYFNDKDEA